MINALLGPLIKVLQAALGGFFDTTKMDITWESCDNIDWSRVFTICYFLLLYNF